MTLAMNLKSRLRQINDPSPLQPDGLDGLEFPALRSLYSAHGKLCRRLAEHWAVTLESSDSEVNPVAIASGTDFISRDKIQSST
jgi:hypothetical protein